MKRIILVLSLIIFCVTGFSQTPAVANAKAAILIPAKPEAAGFSAERLQRIDENINQWIEDGRLNGGVALIIRNGKIIYHKAFGFDDPEKTKPIRTDNILSYCFANKSYYQCSHHDAV